LSLPEDAAAEKSGRAASIMDRVADFLNRIVARKPAEDPDPQPADSLPTEADRADFEAWLSQLDDAFPERTEPLEAWPDRETPRAGLIPMEIASTLCLGHLDD
jgi:hypothetical protein